MHNCHKYLTLPHFFGRQSNCRRFRVKFSQRNGRAAVDNCRQFIAEISPHILVKEVSTGCSKETDSQIQMDVDSQLISPESQHTQGNTATVLRPACNSRPSSDAKGLTVSDLARKVSWKFRQQGLSTCIFVGSTERRNIYFFNTYVTSYSSSAGDYINHITRSHGRILKGLCPKSSHMCIFRAFHVKRFSLVALALAQN